jgi:hypothetical protein
MLTNIVQQTLAVIKIIQNQHFLVVYEIDNIHK